MPSLPPPPAPPPIPLPCCYRWSASGRLRWVLLLLVTLLMTSCKEKPKVLTVLIWNDYLNPKLVAAFEKQEQCSVRFETYASNDELRQMLQEDRFPADVIVPSSYELDFLDRSGFLMTLDERKLPNRKNIDEAFIRDFKLEAYQNVSVPYMVAPTGLAYTEDLPKELLEPTGLAGVMALSWTMLDRINPKTNLPWAAKATLLGEKREALAAALIAAGATATATDEASLKKATEKLEAWCKAGLRLNGKTYQYHLLAGRRTVGHAYLGDVLPLQPKVKFALPKEGFVITCDCLAIASLSKQGDLAHKFINYLCDPEVCAKNMEWTLYRAPNAAAYELFKKGLKEPLPILDFLGSEVARKGRALPPVTKEEEERLNKVWELFSRKQEL